LILVRCYGAWGVIEMLQEPVIRRVTLSRYLFELATQNARSDQEIAGSACVNLLQDAIEIFLLAVSDHLNVDLGPKTAFPQYLDKINEAISDELPFRRRLLEINRVRVLSKHDGIPPNRQEIAGYVSDARKFLEQACTKILGVDFWSISLIQLLDNGDAKNLLLEAEEKFNKGEFSECMVACRKAFYLEFESSYDIQKDLDEPGLLLFGSRAPYYARNMQYVEKNVATPFDYIVLDHSQVDADLTKEGIDHTAFWNIWRLTPAVYRHKDQDEWLVKHEPDKLEKDGIKDRAAYVLENIVAILLARQGNKRKMKGPASGKFYVAKLRQPNTPVYKKADKTGPVEGFTPAGLTEIMTHYATPGLKDKEMYWNVFHFSKTDPWIIGYILETDLDFE
jgi:hypothetical protein